MRRAVRDSFHSWKANLFREPGERGRYQFFAPRRGLLILGVLGAGFLFYYALFGARYVPNPFVLAMGAWVLLGSLAELLPKERTTLAAFLRAGSSAFFVLMCVVLVVDFFLLLAR